MKASVAYLKVYAVGLNSTVYESKTDLEFSEQMHLKYGIIS